MSGASEFPYPGDDPADLSGISATFEANQGLLNSVATSIGQASSSLASNWKADAATEAGNDLSTLKTALALGSKAFGETMTAIDTYRGTLTTIRSNVDDLRRQLDRQEATLSGQQTEYARAGRFGQANDMSTAEIASYRTSIAGDESTTQGAINGLQEQYTGLVSRANLATSTCATALRSSISGQAYVGSSLVPVPLEQMLGLTNLGLLQDYDYNAAKNPPQWPPGNNPAAVFAYWNSLPAGLRAAYIRLYPQQVGNMNGVPITDRSTANVSVADSDYQKVHDALLAMGFTDAQLASDEANDPRSILTWRLHQAGISDADIQRYHTATACLDGMTKDNQKTGATSYLMIYDPNAYSGKGRAAITLGNPDTADDTAVCVPGLGSNVGNVLGGSDAQNLYNQMATSDPTHSHAVVQWIGYDAPTLSNVASENAAKHGAQNLAADVAGLQATHQGAGHLTVIGHSYGSTTTADALSMDGMRPDDVVLIGSPGAGSDATTAKDFGLPPGHVYVGSASLDPVTQIPYQLDEPLGVDPSNVAFGATRFHTEAVDRGSSDFNLSNHTSYYATHTDANGQVVPSESLQNLSDVATGHGSNILTDGEQAGGRYYTPDHPSKRIPDYTVQDQNDPDSGYRPKWGDPSQ